MEKKLRLIKEGEIAIKSEMSIYCDFCGGENSRVFTSTFDDRKDGDTRKCEMQICTACIKQLSKLV